MSYCHMSHDALNTRRDDEIMSMVISTAMSMVMSTAMVMVVAPRRELWS